MAYEDLSQAYREQLKQRVVDTVIYIPTYDDSGGAPVAAPQARTGLVGLCYGTSTKKLYVYTGSAWVASAALS